MKTGLAGMILLVLCFFGGHLAKAQPYRQLSAGDFQGNPERGSNTVAYTHCYIDLKYDVHERNGYYRLTFYVTLEMNKERSWIDHLRINSAAMLTEVLEHEQGHYDIAYFEQQELLHELDNSRFGPDYQTAVKDIFNRIHAKYARLNLDYDEDTDHSQNRLQQASWNKYFRRELDYAARSGRAKNLVK